jgi:precorrin-6A/cobalt-precorrin-6A reductase
VLVLGGTTEGRCLARQLGADPARFAVTYSLAGRTHDAVVPGAPVTTRVGGFGGVAGLVEFLRGEGIAAMVDATHPFARTMSANAAEAALSVGTPAVALARPGWSAEPGDDWRRVATLEDAAELAPALGRRIFLTVGRQGVDRFVGDEASWFLVRSVEAPDVLPLRSVLLLGRGPFVEAGEAELLRRHGIEVLVTKDSGGEATAAKLRAARHHGIPVVVVDRPPRPDSVPVVGDADAALSWLEAQSG